MIRNVLIWFAVATVVILLGFWLFTGGIGKISETARGIAGYFRLPSNTSEGMFRLPGQPDNLGLGPDISGLLFDGASGSRSTEDELAETEEEYEKLLGQIEEAKVFGDPSPHRGDVLISQGTAKDTSTATEYLTLSAAWDNTAPVSITNWSLQSALTGVRAFLPRGAHPFLLGAVNAQGDIYLDPGTSATISSGISPVGTAFRENLCTGYLDELQTFNPALSRNCPAPRDALPLTPENLGTYGDACYDFVQTLSSCSFPREIPGSVSSSCRLFLINNLSYNGCVQNYRHRSSFALDSWRIYLNAPRELWRNTHDIIRLLDAEGRTVDVISY